MSAVAIEASEGEAKGRTTKVIEMVVRGDGIAVLTVNDPREPVNTVTREFGEQLVEHVERIAAVDCGLDFVAVARERAGAECA